MNQTNKIYNKANSANWIAFSVKIKTKQTANLLPEYNKKVISILKWFSELEFNQFIHTQLAEFYIM